MAVGREVAGNRLTLVVFQEVTWDKLDTLRLGNFILVWKTSEPTGTGFFFCISEVLFLCFYWFCSTDSSVGFVGLIFTKIQTESSYDKSVTLAREICKKNCHGETRENSSDDLIFEVI